METFSALLAFCAGNSPVTGEFSVQKPVTRSFDVIVDLHLNKRLSKQSWGWWFETPLCPLWRHCNDVPYKTWWVNSNENVFEKCALFARCRELIISYGQWWQFKESGFIQFKRNYTCFSKILQSTHSQNWWNDFQNAHPMFGGVTCTDKSFGVFVERI